VPGGDAVLPAVDDGRRHRSRERARGDGDAEHDAEPTPPPPHPSRSWRRAPTRASRVRRVAARVSSGRARATRRRSASRRCGGTMSGHSKWSTIKHKKAAKDAKRGKIFTKLIKEITVSVRMGGGDVNANPRLRTAVLTARQNSMPTDNIERAIKKGTGELEGVSYEEITYEAYGPGGVAILVRVLTDNRNRTVADVRSIITKHGGNLAENGAVGWMFKKRGLIAIERAN